MKLDIVVAFAIVAIAQGATLSADPPADPQGKIPDPPCKTPGCGPPNFQPKPCNCPRDWNPVCANGVTYGNPCLAECDGFKKKDYTTGACVCMCQFILDPIGAPRAIRQVGSSPRMY